MSVPLYRLRNNWLFKRKSADGLVFITSYAIASGILVAIILGIGTARVRTDHLRSMVISALIRQATRGGLVIVVVSMKGCDVCLYSTVVVVYHATVLSSSSDALSGSTQACSVLGLAHSIRGSRVFYLGTWLVVSAQSQRSLKKCVRVIRIEV